MNFKIVPARELVLNPEALRFLELAAENFGGILSVTKTLQNADPIKDIFVLVLNEIKLRGAIHLTITHQDVGKVLTSVLLGGVELRSWASDLSKFYHKLAQDNECDEFYYMGRAGFHRLFPELKEVARVYRLILEKPPSNIK